MQPTAENGAARHFNIPRSLYAGLMAAGLCSIAITMLPKNVDGPTAPVFASGQSDLRGDHPLQETPEPTDEPDLKKIVFEAKTVSPTYCTTVGYTATYKTDTTDCTDKESAYLAPATVKAAQRMQEAIAAGKYQTGYVFDQTVDCTIGGETRRVYVVDDSIPRLSSNQCVSPETTPDPDSGIVTNTFDLQVDNYPDPRELACKPPVITTDSTVVGGHTGWENGADKNQLFYTRETNQVLKDAAQSPNEDCVNIVVGSGIGCKPPSLSSPFNEIINLTITNNQLPKTPDGFIGYYEVFSATHRSCAGFNHTAEPSVSKNVRTHSPLSTNNSSEAFISANEFITSTNSSDVIYSASNLFAGAHTSIIAE